MSLLQPTIINDLQDTLAQDRKQYDKQGLLKAVNKSTTYVDYISPDAEQFFATASSERGIEIPVIKEGEAVVSFTPSFDAIPENLTESDNYGFTAVDIMTGFDHYPHQYAENIIKEEFDLQVKLKRAAYAAADAIEDAITTVLNNNKTVKVDYLDQANLGEATFQFNTTDNTLVVDKAGLKDVLYTDYSNILENNQVEGRPYLITSKGGTNEIVKQMLKNGSFQAENLSWNAGAIPNENIFETKNFDANGNAFEGFLFEEGALGIYANHPFHFRQGSKVGTKEWSISDIAVPGVGLKANIIIDRNAVDATSKIQRGSDSVMAVKESFGMWFRFYIAHPYAGDIADRTAPIVKVRATTT